MAEEVKVRGVSIPEYNKNGTLKYYLCAQNAVIKKNSESRLFKLKLLVKGKNETNIKSPFCKFDSVKKLLHSKEKINMKNDAVLLSGECYDFDMKKQILTIHSKVRILINKKK